jgi:hypothetical protein
MPLLASFLATIATKDEFLAAALEAPLREVDSAKVYEELGYDPQWQETLIQLFAE